MTQQLSDVEMRLVFRAVIALTDSKDQMFLQVVLFLQDHSDLTLSRQQPVIVDNETPLLTLEFSLESQRKTFLDAMRLNTAWNVVTTYHTTIPVFKKR